MSAPTVNIAAALSEMADRYPNKKAVVWTAGRDHAGNPRYAHLTFRELEHKADGYAQGLRAVGLEHGMRTLLMVRPGPDFFALTFALLKTGAVLVLIDPGMGPRNMARCLADINVEAFIGVPAAHVFRKLYRQAFRSVRIAITAGRRWFWGGPRLQDIFVDTPNVSPPAPTRADEPAAILFTSGSTGPAKGVLYEHGIFDAQVRYLQSCYGYGPEEIDLPTFPLFALFDAALGMTAVIPEMDFTRPAAVDPRKIYRTIADHGCTHMFGSPALLNRIARFGHEQGIRLNTLKRIITCGAPIAPSLLESLHALLSDDAEIFTPYGATEALPVASIGSREILSETRVQTERGKGTCVGRPLPGIETQIIEVTDDPIADWSRVMVLPPGRIGEIVVKGSIVTREYYAKPGPTALAKIRDGEHIWHRMGDVGYHDKQGRLWFCGRKAHRVQTDQGTLFTVPCEAIFNQHPRVFRTALVGVGNAPRQQPVICLELVPEDDRSNLEQLTRELLALGAAHAHTRTIQTVLYHPSFPVDVRHNAKIFREKLADWAAEQLS